jgi:hypothetical protein
MCGLKHSCVCLFQFPVEGKLIQKRILAEIISDRVAGAADIF